MPVLLLFFWFLEEFFDCADSCFLRQHIACNNCYGFFWAPFDALGSIRFVFAHVADVDYFGFWMQHYGAVVAGFDAPAAAVAFVFV